MNCVLLHISKLILKIFLCKFSFSWLKTHHSENEDLGIQSHHFMANRWGKSGNGVRFHLIGLQITVASDCSHEIERCLLLGRKVLKQRHHFADKGLYSQSYGFSSSRVWMWELDHKEGWAPKNLYFQTVVLEKTLESPLDSKEIKPVNLKGNQPWIFFGRTDDEASVLWPPNVKRQPIGKDPDAGNDWGREEKRAREDEMFESTD